MRAASLPPPILRRCGTAPAKSSRGTWTPYRRPRRWSRMGDRGSRICWCTSTTCPSTTGETQFSKTLGSASAPARWIKRIHSRHPTSRPSRAAGPIRLFFCSSERPALSGARCMSPVFSLIGRGVRCVVPFQGSALVFFPSFGGVLDCPLDPLLLHAGEVRACVVAFHCLSYRWTALLTLDCAVFYGIRIYVFLKIAWPTRHLLSWLKFAW